MGIGLDQRRVQARLPLMKDSAMTFSAATSKGRRAAAATAFAVAVLHVI